MNSFSGLVQRGDGRGRKLGFPTANITPASPLPASVKPGIYAAWARLDVTKEWHKAVIHYGPRPTFPGSSPTLEVHLLDFPDRDLYDERLNIKDLRWIRAIEKFASVEELITAIKSDCEKARQILA